MEVKVIGAGLSGCEAALTLAKRGIKVKLYEAKPKWKSKAHHGDGLAEIVCSNSLKSEATTTASGALKNELNILDCELLKIAKRARVNAGSALAVDRNLFSALVTEKIKSEKNIELISEVVESFDDSTTIVCAGPVCHEKIASEIEKAAGEKSLSFFDAAAPIITRECIDFSCAFFGARYGKGGDDYVNCPMNKDEYLKFYSELINAGRVIEKTGEVFEGCMPIEVMASRGEDALRFGPLRPVGFRDKKPYALLQLRKENSAGDLFNLVGFQTNLKFPEQKRVFSLIPALKNIDIVRYGVMHRNTFINAPKCLNKNLSLKNKPNIYIAGQLCGVEGYVESIATGLLAALNVACDDLPKVPIESVLGGLINYITTPNADFQPMNANFGILPQLKIKKQDRKQAYYDRSGEAITAWKESIK